MTNYRRWASELESAHRAAGAKRIVVCVPHGIDRLPIEAKLAQERYMVTYVHSSAECVNLAYEIRPDAVFVHREMNGLTGEQVRDLLRHDPRTAHATFAFLNE